MNGSKNVQPGESVRDYVHRVLRTEIMELKLEPGTFISEKDIIAKLNVSRTPVREAFIKLMQEDLLETIPQKGSFIAYIDLEHVAESQFVREHLECAIVREAAQRLTTEQILALKNIISLQELCVQEQNYSRIFELDSQFHQSLFYGCGKERSWKMLQQMSTHFNRIRLLRLAVDYDWDVILDQHRNIAKAISKGDADQAEKVMRQHTKLVLVEKDRLKKNYPTYFK